ncbi:MAG TPA: histidine--tRNA ligase [Bacteroides graminisolvens]|uniref:Histidine--tRNA ligase n=2 Tax=Bacteroides graminisolvens TaxID=477666 RepID=A0A3D2SEM7_9BACE|nr:histidine--tRNA ligase [Bacteroides graminisolvens]
MAAKPGIPKGTRDFSPVEMAKRNYIFNTIRDVYHLYGFQQIETPSMEMLSTLMGKYGDEGDKLLFKIQNSGDYFSGLTDEELLSRDAAKLASKFCEKGLRYDLTVPFARYVVMHRDEISFPFKRYQIQPVWRADRPQKGRYREFYQCDADVVGSDSLLNEVELMQIVDEVFTRFGIRVCIKINNRKILTGIAEIINEADKIVDITVAIDKLDKIGLENVNKELAEKGISAEAIDKLQPIILLQGSNSEKLETLKQVLASSETGLKGVEECEFILKKFASLSKTEMPDLFDDKTNQIELDLTLARGLNYYTGAIFEVKALDVQIGSITGGGRYDNLTGVFGMPGVSGVGISFGADRIFDVLNQLELYPKEAVNGTELLFVNFGEDEADNSLSVLTKVRAAGIRAEMYPDSAKMKKQMTYANAKNIPFVAIVGENEMKENKVLLKNMLSGEQTLLGSDELIAAIRP